MWREKRRESKPPEKDAPPKPSHTNTHTYVTNYCTVIYRNGRSSTWWNSVVVVVVVDRQGDTKFSAWGPQFLV
jgi:hypothetical protein